MKRIIFLLSLFVLIGGFSCHNDKKNNTQKPEEFVSEKYGFAVKFANKPTKQESVVPTNIGDVTAVAFGDDQGTEAYIVYVNIYPQDYANQVNASQSIKTQVMETAKNLKLNVIEEKENNYENYPSYYVYGQDPETKLYAQIQGIATGNKVYVIAALAQGDNAENILNTKGNEFLNSFRLLK